MKPIIDVEKDHNDKNFTEIDLFLLEMAIDEVMWKLTPNSPSYNTFDSLSQKVRGCRLDLKKQEATCMVDKSNFSKEQYMADIDLAYGCGYEKGKNERLKSEWIRREDMDFLDENKVIHKHFMCKKCGFIHDFVDGHTSQYNFCPNCGTELNNSILKATDNAPTVKPEEGTNEN